MEPRTLMGEELNALFRERGVIWRDMLLLPPPLALEFLEACRQNGTVLLGFDAFRMPHGNSIQPIMDDSLDLSIEKFSSLTPAQAINLAESFISQRRDKDILFEFVTE